MGIPQAVLLLKYFFPCCTKSWYSCECAKFLPYSYSEDLWLSVDSRDSSTASHQLYFLPYAGRVGNLLGECFPVGSAEHVWYLFIVCGRGCFSLGFAQPADWRRKIQTIKKPKSSVRASGVAGFSFPDWPSFTFSCFLFSIAAKMKGGDYSTEDESQSQWAW